MGPSFIYCFFSRLLCDDKLQTWWTLPRPVHRWCCLPSGAPPPPCRRAARTWRGRRSPPSRRSCRRCTDLRWQEWQGERWARDTGSRRDWRARWRHRAKFTENTWWHEVACLQLGVAGEVGLSSTQNFGPLVETQSTSDRSRNTTFTRTVSQPLRCFNPGRTDVRFPKQLRFDFYVFSGQIRN